MIAYDLTSSKSSANGVETSRALASLVFQIVPSTLCHPSAHSSTKSTWVSQPLANTQSLQNKLTPSILLFIFRGSVHCELEKNITAGSDPLADATRFEKPRRFIPGIRSSAYAVVFFIVFALCECCEGRGSADGRNRCCCCGSAKLERSPSPPIGNKRAAADHHISNRTNSCC